MSKKNQLRIIGGQWRGRKLDIADIPGLRPTGDRIRETLFNWLMADTLNSHCLDLFAGTGALGLECLSRGAQSVILLEKNKLAAKQLEEHCKSLHADGAKIFNQDALVWLENNSVSKHSINLVLIDPPFSENLWDATIQTLISSELLAPEALIYIESPKNKHVKSGIDWELIKNKISGDVQYQLYRQP